MLPPKSPYLQGSVQQLTLYHVEKQIEHDGVEMGVLENGMPYLTERGLTRMCGLTKSALNEMSVNWDKEKTKPRGREILKLLDLHKYTEDTLYLKSEMNGKEINAYTEPVCLAILEFYAFVTDSPRPEAINAFRSLARTSFRAFIYGAVGYTPEQKILESWKHYHDRVDMLTSSVPNGFFSVFREISEMIVPMIRQGVMISDKVIPDISVGKAWSEYWKANNLEEIHGQRIKYDHDYPLYYPQAKSNPQPSFAYPDSCLGEFRRWLRENYIVNKFPSYLVGQVRKGTLTEGTFHKAVEAFGKKQLT